MKIISRINAALGYLEMAILATAVLIMFVVICCQVLFRYVLHQPSPWTEELARYLFIWVSMIGAAYGVYTQAHFGFELLVKKMSPRLQHAGHYFILLSMGILVFVLVVYGLRMVMSSLSKLPRHCSFQCVTCTTPCRCPACSWRFISSTTS